METFRKVMTAARKNMIFRLALSYLKNREDAEDALAEILIKVWSKPAILKKYNNLDAALFSITKNHCLDILRKKKIRTIEWTDRPDYFSDSGSDPFIQEKYEKVRKIIQNLPPKYQLLIHLRMVEGYSMKKIASILNEKVNTVEVGLSRARKKIREEYEKIKS